MQLHNRMERAAASEAEGAALVLLKDNALKEQFVRGVREQSVRQELRRIALNSVDKSFHHMRDEALQVMSDNRPVVSLFGHSFVKRLCHWSGRRREQVVRTLGLQSCAKVIAYGQGGLSF